MAEVAELILKADSSQVVTADKNLQSLNKTGAKTQASTSKITSLFRAQKNALQLSAFQFQDFNVQVQGGVNASRALSQQLPQFFGAFGAGGAILGVFAGIASLAFADVVDGLFAAENATKDLDDALELLSDTVKITKEGTVLLSEEFEILASKSREVAEVQLKARLITAAKATNAAFADLTGTVEDFDSTLGSNSRSIVTGVAAVNKLAKEYGLTGKEVKELAELTRQAVSTKSIEDTQALRDRVSELALTVGTGNEKFTEFAQRTNTATAALEQQRDITEALKTAYEDIDVAIAKTGETSVEASLKATEALDKQRVAAFRLIESQDAAATKELDAVRRQLLTKEELIQDSANRQLEIVKKNREFLLISAEEQTALESGIEKKKVEDLGALKQKQAAEDEARRGENLTATGDMLTALSTLVSGDSKKSFERSKKLAIAGATIKGIQATVNAYERGSETSVYLGAAYAAIAAATTGAQIAQIQGQQYAGRALGGQVRAGESYRVGEFGPEVLTMGSNGGTISPNAANDGGSGIEVINNIKVIGGDGNATVSTQSNQVTDRKVIQDIVINMANNKTSGLMQGIFNNTTAQPRGSR